jgi:hypothetical protein
MAELYKTLEFKGIKKETLGKYAQFIHLGDGTYDLGGCSIPMLMKADVTIRKLKEIYQGVDFDTVNLASKQLCDCRYEFNEENLTDSGTGFIKRITMKNTLKCKPILINSKDKSSGLIRIDGTLTTKTPVYKTQLGDEFQHLYLISLDLDEKIEESGCWYIDDTNTVRKSVTSDKDYWKKRSGYHKIIASTDESLLLNDGEETIASAPGFNEKFEKLKPFPQLSPEYVQQFIKEYNEDNIKDVEVEWERYDSFNTIRRPYIVSRPKLTNNYVKVYSTEPILYKENNIEKQFVTYEIALVLKELGFDEECFGVYSIINYKLLRDYQIFQWDDFSKVIKAPLWQQATDWLREKHKIYIDVDSASYGDESRYAACLHGYNSRKFHIHRRDGFTIFDNYNEALEEGILEAIKLIKEVYMKSTEFIKKKLYELHKKFNNIKFRYEYRKNTYSHLIEVTPFDFFKENKEYINEEILFQEEFEELFPNEIILFISEGFLTEIKKSEFELGYK